MTTPVPIAEQIGPPPGGWTLPDGRHEVDRPDVVGQVVDMGGVARTITSATHLVIVRDGKIAWQAVKARFDDPPARQVRPERSRLAPGRRELESGRPELGSTEPDGTGPPSTHSGRA